MNRYSDLLADVAFLCAIFLVAIGTGLAFTAMNEPTSTGAGCAKPVSHVVRTDSTFYELACTSDVTPVVTVKP